MKLIKSNADVIEADWIGGADDGGAGGDVTARMQMSIVVIDIGAASPR